MAAGSVEEAAAPEVYKHPAVFPGFSLPGGVAPTRGCSFVPAVFLQDAGKGEGILCLCPRAVTLGRVRGKNARVRKSSATVALWEEAQRREPSTRPSPHRVRIDPRSLVLFQKQRQRH